MTTTTSKDVKTMNDKKLENSLPPAMPRKLPFLVSHLIKNVPFVCRPSVANGVFPALGVHTLFYFKRNIVKSEKSFVFSVCLFTDFKVRVFFMHELRHF